MQIPMTEVSKLANSRDEDKGYEHEKLLLNIMQNEGN